MVQSNPYHGQYNRIAKHLFQAVHHEIKTLQNSTNFVIDFMLDINIRYFEGSDRLKADMEKR